MDHAKLVVIRMEEARDSRGISVAELVRRAAVPTPTAISD